MIRTGLDILIDQHHPFLKRQVGLLVNHTSMSSYQYSWTILKKIGFQINTLFSPEHGLYGVEQDQVPVNDIPGLLHNTISLYGRTVDSLSPDLNNLQNIDLLIFDIQDIGCRYYTYMNTLAKCMEVLSGTDIELLVLDRPNPLGGLKVEGPAIESGFESFVGTIPVPVRHGLTAGELAVFYKKQKGLDVHLSVLQMRDWKRSMYFEQTGLPWISPSPNMPTVDTAFLYPGVCLLEGLNVSEGRGTTVPFQIIGAPFIDPDRLICCLEKFSIQGIKYRPVYFRPSFQKYEGEMIAGIGLHVTDREFFSPFRFGVALSGALYETYPEQIQFLKDSYEFNQDHPAFDLLTGSAEIRQQILAGQTFEVIQHGWASETLFTEQKEQFHLYAD